MRRQPRPQVREHRRTGVGEHPARAQRRQRRPGGEDIADERLHLRDELGACIAGADDDEGRVGALANGVGRVDGQLELGENVVA
jgi:hypothetical protein